MSKTSSHRSTYLQREPNAKLLKKLTLASWITSALIFGIVVVIGRKKIPIDIDLGFLPPTHAVLNTLVTLSLLIAFFAIKNKNIILHKRAVGAAVLFSILFILCYVAYHGTQQEIKFGDLDHSGKVDEIEMAKAGLIRSVYLLLLFSHIILAAISLPFILITLSLGYTNHFARHRRMARWVFPLWLYVAATGPICYLMLKPYYP